MDLSSALTKWNGRILLGAILFILSVQQAFAQGGPRTVVTPGGGQHASASTERPAELEGVGIKEQLGHYLDLNMVFTNDKGEKKPLKDYFDGKTPVIISPVYFSCPGLCNFHLNGLTDGLKEMDWTVGDKFKLLSISFDSTETYSVAAEKKENYLKLYGREKAKDHWHFMVADEPTVQKFTQSIGFSFKWNEAAKEWAHASAAIIVTPDGKISRYLPGILFQGKDIKLALNEATQGKIGSFVDSLVLYCFKYDPSQSKYVLYAFNLMKLAGFIMVLGLMIWLMPVWIRAWKDNTTVRS